MPKQSSKCSWRELLQIIAQVAAIFSCIATLAVATVTLTKLQSHPPETAAVDRPP